MYTVYTPLHLPRKYPGKAPTLMAVTLWGGGRGGGAELRKGQILCNGGGRGGVEGVGLVRGWRVVGTSVPSKFIASMLIIIAKKYSSSSASLHTVALASR